MPAYDSGMDSAQHLESFIPLRRAASRLGVPIAWLKQEAEAGRLPHLKIGRRFVFNLAAVEVTLLERASGNAEREVVTA